jgi:hypothetical protein
MHRSNVTRVGLVLGILIVGIFSTAIIYASSSVRLSEGETVYVPVYSHIYVGIKGNPFDLSISLVIRNTDPNEAITIFSVAYFDSNGRLVRNYLEKPLRLGQMGTVDFFVSESDTSGGLGASFLVKWKSATKVNEPVIEGVMAGTKSGQGISFTSRGKAINERTD